MADNFLGLDFKVIVAGCSGGLSIVYALKKPEAWELMAGLVVGGLTANYVAPSVSVWSGLPLLMTAFWIGVAGKWICLAGLKYVKSMAMFKGQ